MKVYATRDSVCAGDDGDAPHAIRTEWRGEFSLAGVVEQILASGYLPDISGGNATWTAVSAIPIAVVAQQWPKPRCYEVFGGLKALDMVSGTLRIHFNYHAQVDPEIVFNVFWGFKLRAV